MDAFESLEVPEKNVRVLKTLMTGRCYVVPMVEQKDPKVGVPFHLVQQPLSDELLASMADVKAVDFCEGFPAFQLTSESPLPIRKRRGVLPNQCADSTIIQCQDLVTVECTTGPGIPSTGGIYDMKTTCVDPTKFKIEVVDRCKELPKYEGQRRQKCYQNFYRDAATALFQATGRAPNPHAQLGK